MFLSLLLFLWRGIDWVTYTSSPKQQQDWRALEFVSQEMKGDRELCTAAVAQDYEAAQLTTSRSRSYLPLPGSARWAKTLACRYTEVPNWKKCY